MPMKAVCVVKGDTDGVVYFEQAVSSIYIYTYIFKHTYNRYH